MKYQFCCECFSFSDKFGLLEGQQPIERQVIQLGRHVKNCKVEIYFLELQVASQSDLENTTIKNFSISDTLEKLQNILKEEFNIPLDKDTRLWSRYTCKAYEKLDRLDLTLEDAGLSNGQLIIIEVRNEDGSWARDCLRLRNIA